ncbi:MAG TPA: hypothetical protein VJL39_00250 [Candidatus Paceibacterota bacterium]
MDTEEKGRPAPVPRVSLFQRGLVLPFRLRRRLHKASMLLLIAASLAVIRIGMHILTDIAPRADPTEEAYMSLVEAGAIFFAFGVATIFFALPASVRWLKRNRMHEQRARFLPRR